MLSSSVTGAEVNNGLIWPNSTTRLSLLSTTKPCSSSWCTHLCPGDWSVSTSRRDTFWRVLGKSWSVSWLTRAFPAKAGYTDVVWVQTGWLLACLKDNSPCENFYIDGVLGLHLIPKYSSKKHLGEGKDGEGGKEYMQFCVLPSSCVLTSIEDFGSREIMFYIQALYYVFYE